MPYFHFTLGPVQSFVAQARRTRDFWAGSFLLSWLSGVAMAATEVLDGTIEFPIPPGGTSKQPLTTELNKRYLAWIDGTVDADSRRRKHEGRYLGPRVGAIPNRFMAEIPDGFGPEQAEQVAGAVRQAWMALALCVWKSDCLYELPDASAVMDLWERQHQHFWEVSWVITEGEADSAALDRRKNWRNHLPPPEPGVKCHAMEGLQELSGVEAVGKHDNDRRRAFWEAVRGLLKVGKADLAEKEMLCAVAYVKRRFAHVFHELDASIPLGGKTLRLKGWRLAPGMPSTSYMAAVHWLETLVLNANPGELAALHDLAAAAGAEHGEWDTRIRCLERALEQSRAKADKQDARRCIALDGNVFFKHVQESPRSYGLKEPETRKVGRWLAEFWDSRAVKAKPPLSPFYAVLMMDGDSLGQHMGKKENQRPIAEALNRFTEAVPGIVEGKTGIVEGNNGMLVYAGGDDVLALLPLEDALNCAAELRQKYNDCFKDSGIPTTLSGGIVYAHVKTALGEVLRQAHEVLDEVAKDGAGRDAIAARVLKPGGEHLTWAQPWLIAQPEGKDRPELARLADEFQQAEGAQPGEFSSKFFYKMRARFKLLEGMGEDQVNSLLAADYLASEPARGPDGPKVTLAKAKEIIGDLLTQCRPVQRNLDQPNRPDLWQRGPERADAALLVRFLAYKGVEAER